MEHKVMTPKSQHGTTTSYVVGFVLSLVFTFIPYYLVTEHIVSGTAILAVILSFALLQMIVQLVFFLHLGREKKPRWQLLFLVGTVGIILVVVGGSIFIMHNLHYNMAPVTSADMSKKLVEDEGIHQIGGTETGACKGSVHNDYKVIIKNGQVKPLHTDASLCDSLTFINEDPEPLQFTFATHPDHGTYAGESEVTARKGRAKTITLIEPGMYQFHDHHSPQTAGSFTVSP